MSSSPSREPLSGLIRQDTKIVGSICIPEDEPQEFIEQFNRCYGAMQMKIESQPPLKIAPGTLRPVGASLPAEVQIRLLPGSPKF